MIFPGSDPGAINPFISIYKQVINAALCLPLWLAQRSVKFFCYQCELEWNINF